MKSGTNSTPVAGELARMEMHIGALRLVVNQSEVSSVEYADDVDFSDYGAVCHGMLGMQGADCPVYCLDENLQVEHEVTGQRRVCLVMRTDSGMFGILCDSARPIQVSALDEKQLPPVVRVPAMPFSGVVLQDDVMAFCIAPSVLGKVARSVAINRAGTPATGIRS